MHALPAAIPSCDASGGEPSARARALRAAATAGVWALGALPVVLGWQRCTFAMLLHLPCPGCGMTRAMKLLSAGQLAASLRMHPLALPVVVAWVLFVSSTVYASWALGTPVSFYKGRFGRVAIAAITGVYGAVVVLWLLRWLGYFGGPVPVY
jgi:hypothetical protein